MVAPVNFNLIQALLFEYTANCWGEESSLEYDLCGSPQGIFGVIFSKFEEKNALRAAAKSIFNGTFLTSTICNVSEKECLYKVKINGLYTVRRECEGEIAAPGGGGAARLFWRQIGYSLSISSLPQPKVDFVNIWVIIGSVLGESVNC